LANYTAEDVKKLREATAAGMLDCKKALDEAEGDYNKALDLIRVKGLKGITKREGRLTSNGAVVAKVEGNLGVMLELNCETDFVAKGERFVALADELLAHLQKWVTAPPFKQLLMKPMQLWARRSKFVALQ
jgi:elongation factor Ts